jgi:hypothetical protein
MERVNTQRGSLIIYFTHRRHREVLVEALLNESNRLCGHGDGVDRLCVCVCVCVCVLYDFATAILHKNSWISRKIRSFGRSRYHDNNTPASRHSITTAQQHTSTPAQQHGSTKSQQHNSITAQQHNSTTATVKMLPPDTQ